MSQHGIIEIWELIPKTERSKGIFFIRNAPSTHTVEVKWFKIKSAVIEA